MSVPAIGENVSPGQLKVAMAKESGGGNPLNKLFGYAYHTAGNLICRTNNVLRQNFTVDSLNSLNRITEPNAWKSEDQ